MRIINKTGFIWNCIGATGCFLVGVVGLITIGLDVYGGMNFLVCMFLALANVVAMEMNVEYS